MKLMLYYTAFYLYEEIHRPYILELYIIDIFVLSFYHLSNYPHPFIFFSNPQSDFFVMEQFQLLQLYD